MNQFEPGSECNGSPSGQHACLVEEEEEDMSLTALVDALGTDVSASPAFQCLDEMLSSGKVCGMKATKLKASYKLLQDTLRSARESEIQVLEEAKRSRAKLERLQAQMKSAEGQVSSVVPDTEAGRLRQQLLHAYNDLKVAEDREYKTHCKLECLREEKLCLEREYEAQPKPAEFEIRAQSLRERREDLKEEVAQRRLEVRSLTGDLEACKMQILLEQKHLQDKKEIIEKTQAELAQLLMAPNQLLKEIDRMSRKKADAAQKVAALVEEASALTERLNEAERRSGGLEAERKDGAREQEGRRALAEAVERSHGALLKERATEKDREVALLGDRGILEMKLMDVETDGKLLNESHFTLLREKDGQMRALKRIEHELQQATEQLQDTQSLYGKTKAQRDAGPKGDARLQRRAELQSEVETLKINLRQQYKLAEEGDCTERQAPGVQDLLRESNRLRAELHNLGCLAQIKADERDQKHRHLRKMEQMRQRIEQERRERDLVIMDLKKLHSALQRRLSQRANVYDLIIGEKNRYVGLKQITSQRMEEMTEKSNILDNEVKILRHVANEKDRILAKARMKHSHSRKLRESLRNDIAKVDWRLREMAETSEENKMEVGKLTHLIDSREQTLLNVTKSYNAATQHRRDLGIQLLEREEEACILFERLNVQEATVARGNVALDALEEEVRCLHLSVAQEQRQVNLKTQQVSDTRTLEGELATFQIQLSEAKDQTSMLARALQDVSEDPWSMFRELKGSDIPAAELVEKSKHLEVRLAKCEEQLMEKELLLDQVTRISQPIREQVENGQQDRLLLAKKLNETRTHMNNTNHRLMAVAAELSMKQAEALALQQQIREQEIQVEVCQRRLEQGLAPSPEMEEEWMRALRDKRRKQREAQEREQKAEEEERSQLPDGVFTTAEPRPNAYVPSSDPLLLPRPYGALAPFKPLEPGANIRHIRKPKPKPIEK